MEWIVDFASESTSFIEASLTEVPHLQIGQQSSQFIVRAHCVAGVACAYKAQMSLRSGCLPFTLPEKVIGSFSFFKFHILLTSLFSSQNWHDLCIITSGHGYFQDGSPDCHGREG